MSLKEAKQKALTVKQTGKQLYKAQSIRKDVPLYILLLPIILLTFFFKYLPMPGVVMAFMDYDIFQGFNSPWVGWDNFIEIFTVPSISASILNTLKLSVLNMIITFPLPIIFALLLNEIRSSAFKRIVQTISYLPHFLSWVAAIGMAYSIYSVDGIINDVRVMLMGEGTERIRFLASQSFFIPNALIISIWKTLGWSSIVFLSAIAGIDAELYEAANIDGANRFKQCIHITVPSIMPTAVMLFILNIGGILSDNFDLVYGLQNAFIDFETLSTVVYKQGIAGGNYSVATALGLFQSGIGFLLVVGANWLSRKVNDIALW